MICDRVAIVVGGRILSRGRLQELISEKIIFTEVTVSGLAAVDLEGLGEMVSSREDKILLKIFEDEKIDSLLARVYERKGKIHSLVPRTETLEDIFVEMVRQG
jgi:ABC-2 type transport system ATP-binding protein